MVFADEFRLSSNGIEYEGIDEVEYPISYGRLESLKSFCDSLGIATDKWPDFVEEDGDPSRVSILDIKRKNSDFKEEIARLSDEQITGNKDLKFVVDEIRKGKMLFITN